MTDRRAPGRPRSETSWQAILTAALELAAETGYAGLTIEGIAARAGVGRQTIYRWWPSKADILLEALPAIADVHVPVLDQGSYQADLRAFLQASYQLANDYPQIPGLLRALMAEAQINPEFAHRFRETFLERRRAALAVITNRAQRRGDLPHRPAPGTVADIVFGVIWYRVLATHQPFDPQLVDDLLGILAPSPPATKPQRATRRQV